MTKQEAIEQLKDLIIDRKSFIKQDEIFEYVARACEMGIEALEKRVNTNVFKRNNAYFCPCCSRRVRCPKRQVLMSGRVKNRLGDNFCPSCGQALKWGEDDGT